MRKRLKNALKTLGLSLAVAFVVIALTAGTYMIFRWGKLHEQAEQMERLIAVSWGDSEAQKAFYGAYVYYEPEPDGKLKVMLAVRIDRSTADSGYQHEPREIGLVSTPEEAVAKWGTVMWSPAGLTLGTGPDAYLFPRAELERHR